jgi:hypothetical protein
LQSLIATRRLLKKTLDDRAVATAFDLIGKAIQTEGSENRLQAVSILGKAAEISKPVAAVAQPLLKAGLRFLLPPTASWGTAEESRESDINP